MNRLFKKTSLFVLGALMSTSLLTAQEYNQPHGFVSANDVENIATHREQVLKMEEWLKWRKANIVPEVMERYDVDMWVVTMEDGALFTSLAKANYEGCMMEWIPFIVFYKNGENVEEVAVDFEEIASVIKKRNPKKIALSERSKEEFSEILGEKLSSKIVSSDQLKTGFLEKRSPEEIRVFEHVCRVAYDIIAEAFSNKVIIPDVTTTDDVNWWIRQRYAELGLGTKDHPTITIQRSKEEQAKYSDGPEHFNIEVVPRNGYNKIIRRGDLISCDTGIEYFGLGTDTQQNAYVLKEGETDVPAGLKLAMDNTNRLQNHFAEAFATGKMSHEIVNDALKAAFAEGLRPAIYAHPIPYYVLRYDATGGISLDRYMEGPDFFAGELEEPVPFATEEDAAPVQENTVYAMELHCWTDVPEWNNQKVRLVLETNFAYKENGYRFLGGRQTEWHVIK